MMAKIGKTLRSVSHFNYRQFEQSITHDGCHELCQVDTQRHVTLACVAVCDTKKNLYCLFHKKFTVSVFVNVAHINAVSLLESKRTRQHRILVISCAGNNDEL